MQIFTPRPPENRMKGALSFAYGLFKVEAENIVVQVAAFFGRLRGDRTHKFFTCPNCRNRLRVPAGKGKIAITCPKCGTRFEGKS